MTFFSSRHLDLHLTSRSSVNGMARTTSRVFVDGAAAGLERQRETVPCADRFETMATMDLRLEALRQFVHTR